MYLHQRKDFLDLVNLIADERGIEPFLVEKDYWIMHVLYGLKKQGFDFELKGGTSLCNQSTESSADKALEWQKSYKTRALYYNGQPTFEEIISCIKSYLHSM